MNTFRILALTAIGAAQVSGKFLLKRGHGDETRALETAVDVELSRRNGDRVMYIMGLGVIAIAVIIMCLLEKHFEWFGWFGNASLDGDQDVAAGKVPTEDDGRPEERAPLIRQPVPEEFKMNLRECFEKNIDPTFAAKQGYLFQSDLMRVMLDFADKEANGQVDLTFEQGLNHLKAQTLMDAFRNGHFREEWFDLVEKHMEHETLQDFVTYNGQENPAFVLILNNRANFKQVSWAGELPY